MKTSTQWSVSARTRLALAACLCAAACGGGASSGTNDNGGAPPVAGAGAPNANAGTSSGSAGAPLGNPSGGGNSTAGSAAGGSGGSGNNALAGSSSGATNGNAGSSAGGSLGAGGSNAGGASGGGPSSTTVAFDSDRVIVTGVRGTTTPAAQSVITLHNGGQSAVQVTALALSGANQALFHVTSKTALPATLAAGADLAITVELLTTGATLPAAPADKNTGSVLLTGTLNATLGSASASASASVYGLVLTLVNYEPTLGQILTTLGYKLNVGKAQNNWNPNTSMNATDLPGVEAGTDEVAASHFVKAAGATNVSMALVARFSPVGALPYGWYDTTTGCPTGCTTVGTMAMVTDAQTSDKARMVYPPLAAGSMTTFDPGSAPFGLWVYSDQKTQKFNEGGTMSNGDWDYSQDALNSPANVHRFKSYPLKDATGVAIPQTYLVAVEEAGNGDYQDYVFILGGVTAMP